MTKNVLLILALLCLFSVNAQFEWTPAKVILKNGTSFRGLVKFPKHSGGLVSIGSTKFKYKKKKKSEIIKYGSDTVYEVVFGDEDYTTAHYQYVPIKKSKSVLMERLTQGKVSLYTRIVLKSQTTHNDYNPNLPSTVTFYDDSQYYLKRSDEEVALLIVGSNSFGNFISKAKKYFSDCSSIVSYLENDLYSSSDLLELVEDYNLMCE